jgi:hypothetical protein
MRFNAALVAAFVVLLATPTLLAKPTDFECHGLSYSWFVTLEVSGKTAKGTYRRYDNRVDETRGPVPFTGKVIPTPKGKRGVYLQIQFANETPYEMPDKKTPLIWHLKIVEHRAHLFIPMVLRNFETVPAKFELTDLELEPVENEAPKS